MTKHTPGPWHWEADAVKGDPYGRVRYQVTALGKTITHVYYSSFEGGPTNADADARLIAAAPDLLAALTSLLENGDTDSKGVFRIRGLSENAGIMQRARAAISKATSTTNSHGGN